MKVQATNRKRFLRGQFEDAQTIRPPWSIEESLFESTCTRCFKCAQACPSHLIVKGAGGYPEMSFLRQGCDFCEACVSACPEKSLSLNVNIPWQQMAAINDQCFASRGVVCRSCGEICENEAIEFKLVVGGTSQIKLNTADCNGCGECVHVCPAHAIKIVKTQVETSHENYLSGDNQ